MFSLNSNYLKLKAGYLFPEIARRVKEFSEQYPDKGVRLIRCGIGDVTEPLPAAAREAMHQAIDEMGDRDTFRGYGPEQGYEFLRRAIAENDYRARGITMSEDEIFISDGSKCDGGNILDILGNDNRVAVMDPVYPVYVDTNVMAGRTGVAREDGSYEGIVYLPCTPENHFVPALPQQEVAVIYLCYPNNPTGAVASREALTAWVEYAREHQSLILFDAAYEAYIQDPEIPHSIYEISGARECAIEFRSFSKNGGFTGVRCGFTVVPKELMGITSTGDRYPLHPLWHRHFTTKFNGVSYITQRGAAALYTEQGKSEVSALIKYYMENAAILREAATAAGLKVYGGVNAPYLWIKNPSSKSTDAANYCVAPVLASSSINDTLSRCAPSTPCTSSASATLKADSKGSAGESSWQTFDRMLHDKQIVVTPGSGFGRAGEGFFRISAFNSREKILEAARRL